MGWFDGASEVSSHSHRKSSSSGRHHSHHSRSEPTPSIFGIGNPKHNSSRSSFFSLGEDKHRHNSHSASRAFFGFGGSRSSSYYKRSPRSGYINRIYSKLRRLFRDLIYYMKKNPVKVFMLVIMPLITGGALTGLLAKFGIRLPAGLNKMFGGGRSGMSGMNGMGGMGGMGRRSGGIESALGGLGGLGSAMGGMGGISGAMSLAKMFM